MIENQDLERTILFACLLLPITSAFLWKTWTGIRLPPQIMTKNVHTFYAKPLTLYYFPFQSHTLHSKATIMWTCEFQIRISTNGPVLALLSTTPRYLELEHIDEWKWKCECRSDDEDDDWNSVYLNFILFRSWRLLHIHSIIRVPLFSIFLHFNPIFKWSWNNLLLGENHLLILIDQPTDRPTKPTHRNSNSHIKSTTKPTHTPTYFLFIRKRNTFGPIQFSLIINCKVCSAD